MMHVLQACLSLVIAIGVLVVVSFLTGRIDHLNGEVKQLQVQHSLFCETMSPAVPMKEELHALGC